MVLLIYVCYYKGTNTEKGILKVKKRKKKSYTSQYVLIFAVLALFCAVICTVMWIASRTPPTASPNSPESPDTAAPLDTNVPSTEAGEIGYGDVFKVSSSAELNALSSSLTDYVSTNGTSPTVIVSDGAVFDTDVSLRCGVGLLFVGRAKTANGARINIVTKDSCEITLTTDLGKEAFLIDAPNASVTWTGGNVPFMYEIAREMNVGTYNGSPVTDGGDKLGGAGDATVTGITLYTGKNKTEKADATVTVSGNIITLSYPWDFTASDIKKAYIDITTDGKCTLNTSKSLDLTSPSLITVADGNGDTRTYRLTSQRRSYGIPILEINTASGKDITSRNTYVDAEMILDGETYPLTVRGRGNTSWHTFPKKAYRIKLDDKAKLCGMSSNRDWVLIANYVDPSLIRNHIASDIAHKLDGLEFTPSYVSCDLYINGKYYGIYSLGEKIEEAKNKVNLGDPVTDADGNVTDFGFLCELGWDYFSTNIVGKDYFSLDYIRYVYIKEPTIEKKNNATYKYIYNYIKATEDAIVAGEGWEEYIDLDSWVDWFIVNEFCNNTESAMHRSFFMYKPVGGKLTAGPIWDYDLAFGNSTGDLSKYDRGWVAVDSTYGDLYQNWFYFLLRDDDFVDAVKARWKEIGETLYETALESLDRNASAIENAVDNNFEVWDEVLGHRVLLSRTSRLYKTWDEQLDYIRGYLKTRYSFMNERLSRSGSIL